MVFICNAYLYEQYLHQKDKIRKLNLEKAGSNFN